MLCHTNLGREHQSIALMDLINYSLKSNIKLLVDRKAKRIDEIKVFEMFELNIDIVDLEIVACSRWQACIQSK